MLKPSNREKKRYILFHFSELNENIKNFEEIKKKVHETCLNFLGELNYANAGIIVLPEHNKNYGIIRVSKDYVCEAKVALGLIKEINGTKTSVRVPKTSGNLNKIIIKLKGVE